MMSVARTTSGEDISRASLWPHGRGAIDTTSDNLLAAMLRSSKGRFSGKSVRIVFLAPKAAAAMPVKIYVNIN